MLILKKKEYVINDEALEFISGIPSPIGVVGVNFLIIFLKKIFQ